MWEAVLGAISTIHPSVSKAPSRLSHPRPPQVSVARDSVSVGSDLFEPLLSVEGKLPAPKNGERAHMPTVGGGVYWIE